MSFYTSAKSSLFRDSLCRFVLSKKDMQTLHGKSLGPYASLNLAYHVGDQREHVAYNRQIITRNFYPDKKLLFLNQIHSNHIAVISYYEASKQLHTNFHIFDAQNYLSYCKEETNILVTCDEILVGNADGIICNDKRFVGMIMVADCNPILLFCPKREVFALLHAGRQGVCNFIVSHAVQLMKQYYGVKPEDMHVFIGASIRQCCYQIGEDLAEQIQSNFGEQYIFYSHKQYKFDMIKLLCDELTNLGIYEKRREILPICSCCNKDYFSYRRDIKTGRFGLFASL